MLQVWYNNLIYFLLIYRFGYEILSIYQNRGAPCTRQSFKKSTSKNPKKKNKEDEESETESCCDDKQNLTDIEQLLVWHLKH